MLVPNAFGDYSISAQYILSIKNEMSPIKNPFIKSYVYRRDFQEFLFLTVDMAQMERNVTKFQIYSQDVVDNLKFDVTFEGDIAGFDVLYKHDSVDNNGLNFIKLKPYSDINFLLDEEYYCFYKIVDENKLEISFSPKASMFRPRFNSELSIEVYTSKGSSGNFSYSGENILFYLEKDEFFSNDFEYRDLLNFALFSGEAIGGRDKQNLSELRKYIVEEFSTRGNFITENDLNIFFNRMATYGYFKFLKKRDDIIARIFSCFLLPKNSLGNIIPANTIDITVNENEVDGSSVDNESLILRTGTQFHLKNQDYVANKVSLDLNETLALENKIVDSNGDLETNFIYALPLQININLIPTVFISYYLTSIFKDNPLYFNYVNEDSYYEFIINKIQIIRDSSKTDIYTLKFELATNLGLEEMIEVIVDAEGNKLPLYDTDGKIIPKDNIRMINLIKEGRIAENYFKFDLVGYDTTTKRFTYSANLETNNHFNSEGKMSLMNCIYSIEESELKERYFISNKDIKFNLGILYNGYPEKKKINEFGKISGLDNYTLTNIFESEEDVALFTDFTNMVKSNVKIRDVGGSLQFDIKSVPTLRSVYFFNETLRNEIYNLIKYYNELLNTNIELIEGNFDIDLKFYNTYGASRYFKIGLDQEPLNRTNINLNFKIKIKDVLSPQLKADIESYISNYLTDINNDAKSAFYISNLIRQLEKTFDAILFIQFESINDYSANYQIIENHAEEDFSVLSKEQVINYVPEYLNIHQNRDNKGNFVPALNIEYL